MKYWNKPNQILLELGPKEWCDSINKDCPICRNKLFFRQAGTICNCFMFIHKECIIRRYNKQHACNLPAKIVCTECNQVIKAQFEHVNQMERQLKIQGILILFSLFILIATTVVFMVIQLTLEHINIFRFMAEVMLLIVFAGGLIFAIFSIIFKSKYILKQVFLTDRKIKISAFQGILTDRGEPDTIEQLSNVSNGPLTRSQ